MSTFWHNILRNQWHNMDRNGWHNMDRNQWHNITEICTHSAMPVTVVREVEEVGSIFTLIVIVELVFVNGPIFCVLIMELQVFSITSRTRTSPAGTNPLTIPCEFVLLLLVPKTCDVSFT